MLVLVLRILSKLTLHVVNSSNHFIKFGSNPGNIGAYSQISFGQLEQRSASRLFDQVSTIKRNGYGALIFDGDEKMSMRECIMEMLVLVLRVLVLN